MRVHFFAAVAAVLFAMASSAPAEAKPGWCSSARNKAEHTICGNYELGNLDDVLNTAYHRARSDSYDDRHYIRTKQRAWLKVRNGCGYSVNCLRNRYYEQISFLEGYFYN